MWQNILKTINVTTGKTKTVGSPLVEEDEDCERRFFIFRGYDRGQLLEYRYQNF